MLGLYAADFDTVELNNSFYRLPTIDALRSWRDATPKQFCFAVKASRYLTHMKKLKDPEGGLRTFFSVINALEEKLGPILFQLPPRWACNAARLSEFLGALPKGHRYAFEFRDPSWYASPIYQLLDRHNAALCLHDMAGSQAPLIITADFTYIRLHGPAHKKYHGDYPPEMLTEWAGRIQDWRNQLVSVYVYFNNDVAGYAVKNARELKELVGGFVQR